MANLWESLSPVLKAPVARNCSDELIRKHNKIIKWSSILEKSSATEEAREYDCTKKE